LLRYGKFKASGRSKPAHEYLLRCAVEDGCLPAINGPVDLLNAVSLDCCLPISLLAVNRCSEVLSVDRGQPGQQYVFNSAGQTLDVCDLITVFDSSLQPPQPVGTPVKDSLVGKIQPGDNHLVAIIYSPKTVSASARCQHAADLLARGMLEYCGAAKAVPVL
jgi:DNA/RNA-binding domain of Phe-tRNA-synthetase-like protein